MGLKGSGKTARLIEMLNIAVEEENGDVVCIEKGERLRYNISHKVRLVEASHYSFNGYDFLKGFICGLFSANYDITHIFIDSLLRLAGSGVDDNTEEFLDWCENFSSRENVKLTFLITADIALATDRIRKYI